MVTKQSVLVGAATAAVLGVAVEAVHWLASRRGYGHRSDARGAERLVVLGYPSQPDGRLHPLQRWRSEIAARSIDPRRDFVLIFTGGGRESEQSEAEVMATYAIERLDVEPDRIRLERQSRSTWENIARTLPMLEGAGSIKIISDPLHALRGRRYLRKQAPELADRLTPAEDYRPGERCWLKAAVLGYELPRLLR